MDFILKIVVLLFLTAIVQSCNLLIVNCVKPFDLYKSNSSLDSSNHILTKGVYVGVDKSRLFYLYDDGSIKFMGFDYRDDFWKSPDEVLMKIKNMKSFNSSESWGVISLKGDIINIESFNRNNMEFCDRAVLAYKGEIINDSVIFLEYNYSYARKDTFQKNCRYKFYPTSNKPDSTNAWFKKKKWFIKNVHESRK